MTREQAKREIDSLDYYLQNHTDDYSEESHTAMMMAIKALEQEPCGDAISREAVCNIVDDIRDCISVEGYWAILERLKKLPSVKPKPETVTEFADRCRECGAKYGKLLKQQPKTGHWQDLTGLFFCSECDGGFAKPWRYCPECGAKMEEQA